jgi:uncharacterized protein
MKRLFPVALLCLAFGCCALAQQTDDTPATKEDVQRYFQVTHSRDTVNKMMQAMLTPLHQMIHDDYVKDKDKLPEDYEARMNKRMDDLFGDMPWEEMFQAMIPAYQKHLSKGDIDGLITFYSSSTGQKLLREMPAIMAESMQSMLPLIKRHVEKVQDQLQEETAEMIKQSVQKQGQETKN